MIYELDIWVRVILDKNYISLTECISFVAYAHTSQCVCNFSVKMFDQFEESISSLILDLAFVRNASVMKWTLTFDMPFGNCLWQINRFYECWQDIVWDDNGGGRGAFSSWIITSFPYFIIFLFCLRCKQIDRVIWHKIFLNKFRNEFLIVPLTCDSVQLSLLLPLSLPLDVIPSSRMSLVSKLSISRSR